MQNPSSRAACHGNPSLGPAPPYFTFRPVPANQLKAPWSPLCFHQVGDGGYGVLFLNCSLGHVALLLKSPQRLSSTMKGQTGPRRYQLCTGRKHLWTASFVFLSTEKSGFSWFLHASPEGQRSQSPGSQKNGPFCWKQAQHPCSCVILSVLYSSISKH